MQYIRVAYILVVWCMFLWLPVTSPAAEPAGCLSAEEVKLVLLINRYRNDNGLPSVPVTASLTQVAQWHVIDLHENAPNTGSDHGYACNMHSWSDAGPSLWSAVCYTEDHQYADGMWDKPREITESVYIGNGFENAYRSSAGATAEGAFTGWKNSSGHNAVILELGDWSGQEFPAMGVGIYENYAVLWFGDAVDPRGAITACDQSEVDGETGTSTLNVPLPAILRLLLD